MKKKSSRPKSPVSEQFEPPPSRCLQSLMPPPCAKPDPSMLIPPNFEERPCSSQSYSHKLHLHPKPLSCPYLTSAPLSLQSLQKAVQTVKSLPAMQETWVWSLGWEDPLRREWQPTPVFLPGEFHGQRSLAVYTVHGVAKNWTWLSD